MRIDMKNILFTTTAIVGLTALALTADPSAVSDQPYFANANPIAWSGAMSIKLTNPSNSDSTDMKTKDEKKDRLFGLLGNNNNAGVTG